MSCIYGLLLHQSDQLLSPSGKMIYQSLLNMKELGMVEKIGVSIYSPSELDALVPEYRFDIVQAPFNLIDQRFCKSGWIKRLKEDNVEIHTRSAFLQGLLLMSQVAIPSKFNQWSELWAKWHKWLSSQNISAVQACLAFPLSFPEIDQVIVGADSLIQLQQILEGASNAQLIDFPNLSSDDENLINPYRWSQL